MSTKEDRSISSAISFPQWMKNKSTRFELDPSAFSPTELDDNFMLYYRKPKVEEPKIPETTIIATNLPENITVATVTKKKADFSQQSVSCQNFLPDNQVSELTAVTRQNNSEMKIKPLIIVDEGSDEEAAAKCGSSIIKVASEMISIQGLGLRPCEQEAVKYNGRQRRNSKSLPASPSTSPKANRKMNKYFTGAFTDVDKPKGGWILSNLLAKRELCQSADQIKEEVREDLERASSTYSIKESKTPPVLRAKPSELREMNFWSPTSM
ncbi:uncharacterized protein LOC130449235 isoform X1 [Diorhabda sublineata]|uniref:uncharacterized protein LOC130449235 isoform X1 n=1 Tax=Diorhabda sublineata TaxID=1163346 RepID=UPI0024E04526|nr:uncharacterized protein LOC130449235 isoform X1 [Diorhabda sublineata]XP_056642899.1 uncharacterized protein LOC130449235 isoform X1 [Diorhabda sublineata]